LSRTLLPLTPATRPLWERHGWNTLSLQDAMTVPDVEPWFVHRQKLPPNQP
jgi:hypothetical protein